MSHEGILSLFLCCTTGMECIDCFEKNRNQDHYREVENYCLIYDYQLTDNRFIRNRDDIAICGWCNEIVIFTPLEI